MSLWLTLFILISCNYVTCSKTESPCHGFHGTTLDVRGVIGEYTSLTCNVPTNCTRGLWKYDDTINPMWLLAGEYSGDTYRFSFNPLRGVNTLHIYNINGSVAGLYNCLCDDDNGRRTVQACFNLSVHAVSCPMIVQINGEKRVFDRCGMRSVVEMIDVEVKKNITIKCEKAKRTTNCSHIGKGFSFTVNPSHHQCRFSCIPKKGVKRVVISIILNVRDNVISTSTMKLYTKTIPLTNLGNLTSCDGSPSTLYTPLQIHDLTVNVPSYIPHTSRWTINILILHIIIPSSITLVFGMVVLSTCAYVLFHKIGVCTSSIQYNAQTADNIYHDIVEMQSPDINSFYITCIDHQTDLGDNEIALLSTSDSSGNNRGASHFNETPDTHCTFNTIGQ
ncbi:hypothetical protein HOLleu_24668 [Holothuria leucospilota]|uniref:Ig-like domain-containing protein n=1 Tax=Holothuria leucospilota TaxID=206669 RepID=A0A9Q1H402_HOLLE|nr:hypothetical protein HOLleu_24668 [Holothuria leucospilota]